MNTRLAFHLAHARLNELHSTAAERRRTRAPTRPRTDGVTAPFAAMFAAQAGLLSLGPVLAPVARELDVSIAAAGQLRERAERRRRRRRGLCGLPAGLR
jgi:hypothetical protein